MDKKRKQKKSVVEVQPVVLSIMDYVIHFNVDHIKSSLVKRYNWTQSGKMYWIATTVDQNLHFATYLLIVLLA